MIKQRNIGKGKLDERLRWGRAFQIPEVAEQYSEMFGRPDQPQDYFSVYLFDWRDRAYHNYFVRDLRGRETSEKEIEHLIRIIKENKNQVNLFIKEIDGTASADVKPSVDYLLKSIIKSNNPKPDPQEFFEHLLRCFVAYPQGEKDFICGKLNGIGRGPHYATIDLILEKNNLPLPNFQGKLFEDSKEECIKQSQIYKDRASKYSTFYINVLAPFFSEANPQFRLRRLSKLSKLNSFNDVTWEKTQYSDYQFSIFISLYDVLTKTHLGYAFRTFKSKDERSSWMNKHEKALTDVQLLLRIVERASEFDFLEATLGDEPDYVEKWIKYLPLLFRLDRASVYILKENGEVELSYSYWHEERGIRYEWKRQTKSDNEEMKEEMEVVKKAQGSIYIQNSYLVLKGLFDDKGPFAGDLSSEDIMLHSRKIVVLVRKDIDLSKEWRVADQLRSKGLSLLRQLIIRERRLAEIKKHSARAAVSAIMARNMAHHEGSNVLPRARISDIRQRYHELVCSTKNHDPDRCPVPLEVIEGLKDRLDEYIQKKQDFLAEITSEPLTTTKTAYFFQDIIAPLIQNVLLMDTLAANEGVRYLKNNQNCLLVKVLFKGQEIKAKFSCGHPEHTIYADCFPYTGLCEKNHPSSGDALLQFIGVEPDAEDFPVELPGPVGEHAFYAFLENLIRNAAKHNLKKLQKNPHLEICIDIYDEDEEFYRVEISDNLTDSKKLKEISAYLKNPFIKEETGELRREAWGIAEMKTSAALLKGYTKWEKLKNKTVCEYLDVLAENDRLVYRFYMMKPKKVCALLPGHNLSDDHVSKLKKEGIWVFKSTENIKEGLLRSRSAACFKFAFLDLRNIDEQGLHTIKDLLPRLPFRIVVQAKEAQKPEIQKLIPGSAFADSGNKDYSTMNDVDIVRELWRLWLGRWTPNASLHVYLEQDKNEPPTSKWLKFVKKWQDKDYQLNIWYDESKNGRRSQEKCSSCSGNQSRVRQVAFDRHAIIAARCIDTKRIDPKRIDPKRLGFQDSYFTFDKLSSDFTYLFASEPSSELVYSLLEAGLLEVLIVDSRIAERAYDYDVIPGSWLGNLASQINSSNFPGVPKVRNGRPDPMRWHLGCIGKVLICTHFGIGSKPTPLHPKVQIHKAPYLKLKIDMEGSSAKNIEMKLKGNDQQKEISISIGKSLKSQNGIGVDMLIIHQGDIDTRKPRDGFDLEKFVESLKGLVPFVVIDSGRGIPPEVQCAPSVKFLPFSLINELLAGKRINKLRLTQVLMALTRRIEQ